MVVEIPELDFDPEHIKGVTRFETGGGKVAVAPIFVPAATKASQQRQSSTSICSGVASHPDQFGHVLRVSVDVRTWSRKSLPMRHCTTAQLPGIFRTLRAIDSMDRKPVAPRAYNELVAGVSVPATEIASLPQYHRAVT